MTAFRKKDLFYSVMASLAIGILRFYPPANNFLDSINNSLSKMVPSVPLWVIQTASFVVRAAIIYCIIRSRVGGWLYSRWTISKDWLATFLRGVFGMPRDLYGEGLRDFNGFRRDILRSLESSPFMYCLLVSGYTMFHEGEDFLLNALQDLPMKTRKDLRFLLLDPSTTHWVERAKELVQHRLSGQGIKSVESYRQLCNIGAEAIRSLPGARVAYYHSRPSWRLHIFSDRIYTSRYAQLPDAAFRDGHLAPVAAFEPEHPMYKWLYGEFRRRCPDEWQRELSLDLAPSG